MAQQQQQQAESSTEEGAPPRAHGDPESSSTAEAVHAAPTAVVNDNNNNNSNSNNPPLIQEIQYAMDSFYAIVKPVLLTMILAALSVVYIRTDESAAAGEEALTNSYTVVGGGDDGDSSSSTVRVVGESVVNALVIVSVICALTFLIVLMYKYKFMKCLIGYMILSSGMLLGFLASQMFVVAIDRYHWTIDKVTFGVLMYNFAVTGCVSIFAPPGVVSPAATQGYLIATSVIVAWQLSHFSEILAWVLLVLLACYDLFAVLSPCGPLKALVKLMQSHDAPPMPGLLYEASLPNAPGRARPENSTTTTTNGTTTATEQEQRSSNVISISGSENNNNNTEVETHNTGTSRATAAAASHRSGSNLADATDTTVNVSSQSSSLLSSSIQDHETNGDADYGDTSPVLPGTNDNLINDEDPATRTLTNDDDTTGRTADDSNVELVTGLIPLALARLYKLRFVRDPQPYWITAAAAANRQENPTTTAANAATTNGDDTDDNNQQNNNNNPSNYNYSPFELTALVEVLFSSRGGRIVPTLTLPDADNLYRQHAASEETRYTVVDQHGQHRRVLFVNREGRIFEDLRVQNAREEVKERTSIRLGLGDFIFYSILVSKAALYSFTAFCACALAVVAGMGLTLCLLAVYGKALPALPISIALGVVFYLTTRYVAEPWVHAVFIEQVYV